MKKLILKATVITVCITVLLAVSVFGVLSFTSPVLMMQLTDSIGIHGMSVDYAYEAYSQSGDLQYLVHAAELSHKIGRKGKAAECYTELIEHQSFDEFCAEQDEQAKDLGYVSGNYEQFTYGRAACAYYHTADTEEAKAEVCAFAVEHTEKNFPKNNAVIALMSEAGGVRDGAFCKLLLGATKAGGFEQTEEYLNIIKILEELAE